MYRSRQFLQFLLNSICGTAAESIDVYLRQTRCTMEDVPEHYISSTVANKIGCLLPAMMEVEVERLVSLMEVNSATQNQTYIKRKKNKVDLIVFEPNEPNIRPRSPILLVEFKRWEQSEGDVVKLREIVSCLEEIEHVAICFTFNSTMKDNEWLRLQRSEAEALDQIWASKELQFTDNNRNWSYSVCGRIMSRAYVRTKLNLDGIGEHPMTERENIHDQLQLRRE